MVLAIFHARAIVAKPVRIISLAKTLVLLLNLCSTESGFNLS
jgi:hypothetical protein